MDRSLRLRVIELIKDVHSHFKSTANTQGGIPGIHMYKYIQCTCTLYMYMYQLLVRAVEVYIPHNKRGSTHTVCD